MIICLGPTPALQRTMHFAGLRVDEVNRATETDDSIAGKSVNVAKVLRTLGEEVVAAGFAGGDRGRQLLEGLAALGIRHDFVTVAPRTRQCVTVIDRSNHTQTELVEESRPVGAQAYGELIDALLRLMPGARMLILSGTLTPDGPQEFYQHCLTIARSHGVRTIIDAAGPALLAALAARPEIVKPNQPELARTLGRALDDEGALRSAVKELLSRGAESAVITLGARGALACRADRFWRVIPPRVQALNPIGSGDALTAGLAAGLLRGQDLPDALRLGAACGAANALTPLAGVVHSDDVYRLCNEVEIAEL